MKPRQMIDHFDREIIRFLAKRGKSNTNEVSDKLGISWATADVHLKKLMKSKFVKGQKEGKLIVWKVNR